MSAVIKSHEDADHVNGLPNLADNDVVNGNTRFITYNNCNIGNDIWGLLGEMKPIEAPNMECISSNGNIRISNTHMQNFGTNNENNRSLGFLIKHGDFRFFTAGDLESSHENNIYFDKNVSIIKAGHHGSKHSTSQIFLNRAMPRASIISHGNRKFGNAAEHHPDSSILDNLQNSSSNFNYLTNPCSNELNKNNRINQSTKFVVAGQNNTLLQDGVNKNPRGNIIVKSYQSQANEDKFTINYKHNNVKTRDYYKNGSFINKADSVKNAMSSVVITNLEDGKQKTNILLTKKEMKVFLDENNKIKHLNVEKFIDATKNMHSQKQMYKKLHKRRGQPIYQLSTTVQDQQIKFDVHGNGKHLLTKEYYPDTQINKLIARRTERGTSNDRKI